MIIYQQQLFCGQVDFNDTTLIVTEPFFNFQSIQEAMTEVLFEDYQFKALYRCNGMASGLLFSVHHYPLLQGFPWLFLIIWTCSVHSKDTFY